MMAPIGARFSRRPVVCMLVQDAADSSCKCLLQSEKQLMKCVVTELEHLLSLCSRAQQ
jgi:hypothetical protein